VPSLVCAYGYVLSTHGGRTRTYDGVRVGDCGDRPLSHMAAAFSFSTVVVSGQHSSAQSAAVVIDSLHERGSVKVPYSFAVTLDLAAYCLLRRWHRGLCGTDSIRLV
jgi:hypothetical protein